MYKIVIKLNTQDGYQWSFYQENGIDYSGSTIAEIKEKALELLEEYGEDNIKIVDEMCGDDLDNVISYVFGSESGTTDYNELENKPTINNIELKNNKTLADLGIINFSGNYEDLTNKPSIPTKTSDLENDEEFITQGEVINDVTSTETKLPLSANMGKELQDQINNLKSRGRYLALWNCVTGLPTTNPTVMPYEYKTGDYYIISNIATGGCTHTITITGTTPTSGGLLPEYDGKAFTVTFSFKNNVSTQYTNLSDISAAIGAEQELEATGNIDTTYQIYGIFAGIDETTSTQMLALLDNYPWGQKMSILTETTATISNITDVVTGSVSTTNYKPNGASYAGTASTTVETNVVAIDDVYYYDGAEWKLQINTQKTVSFTNIAGQPGDNSNLAAALDNKQNTLISGENIKTINSTSILGNGNIDINSCLMVTQSGYTLSHTAAQMYQAYTEGKLVNVSGMVAFLKEYEVDTGVIHICTYFGTFGQIISITGNQITNITEFEFASKSNVLTKTNTTAFTPTTNYHPATKKYVDDYLTTITGYDATAIQELKNINGTLTWVTEE